MKRKPHTPAVVLCCAGHDPTGGAGLSADVEAVRAQGAHPASLVTALTVQDSHNVHQLTPMPAAAFLQQARCLIADLPIAAIKLGLLGSAAMVEAVLQLTDELAYNGQQPPLLLDPVLHAGGGSRLADAELLQAMVAHLLPRSLMITPNLLEARALAAEPDADHDACAAALHRLGARWILITGGDESTQQVSNRLYAPTGSTPIRTWQWPRLPGHYHGSGCTLASACAAQLAQAKSPLQAADMAQYYTQQTLQQAYALGSGQCFPARWPVGV